MVWGDGNWLLDANNKEALFINGMGDICTGRPSGAALLARAEGEGDLQVVYVLAVLNYYKHGTTKDVFNLIHRVYGEVTSGSQVGGRWWTEDGVHDKDDARAARVRHRVGAEIGRVMWREHINQDHVYELHLSDDSHKCLWKRGCGRSWIPVFCSLRRRIRDELYGFLIRFPMFHRLWRTLSYKKCHHVVSSPNAMYNITDLMPVLQQFLLLFTTQYLSSYNALWCRFFN
jgi:hypothetical protein